MIDWAERSVCLMLSLGILANALVVRRAVGAWAFPAVLFSLFWFFFTFIPLISFPGSFVYAPAMLYILAVTVVFSISAVGVQWHDVFVTEGEMAAREGNDIYRSPRLFAIFVAAFVAATVFLVFNVLTQGISLAQLATNLTETASEYAQRRYSEDLIANSYQQIGNVLAYFCAGVGGLIIIGEPRIGRMAIIIAGALVPAIFVMLSQSAKGMLFLCLALFFGGTIVARLKHGHTSLLSRRAMPTIAVGGIVLGVLVTISFIARGGAQGGSVLDFFTPFWASYTSGHLFAFSDWFSFRTGAAATQGYADPGLTKGFYTFMSVFKALGDDRIVPIGIYDEFFASPPFIQTNIYTAFRGLIQDFGMAGSLLVIGAAGIGVHRAFKSMLVSAMPTFSAAAMIMFMAFTYQSFAASALTWATLPLGVFLIGVALFVLRMAGGLSASNRDERRMNAQATFTPNIRR